MYIGPQREKRQSSPIRVVFLLLLIFAGLYIYALIKQEHIENPFEPTPIPPTPTRSALSYADEAKELYQQGKLAQAIIAYEQAITLDPDDVLLYIPKARLLALEGRTIEAVRCADQAIEMAPENSRAWAVRGMAHDWNGDVPEAIDDCKRAIELDPTYAEAYAYLAEAYADVNRWVDAVEVAQTALQLDDRSVDAHRNYGYVLEDQGNYWEAVEQYERALELHPNLTYIHIAVGWNYVTLGDHDAAISSFQRAIDINPNDARIYYELGRMYIAIGEYEQAETYCQQAVETDVEYGQGFGCLAISYYRRRNYESAAENFESAIELECVAAWKQAESFYITIEDMTGETEGPSSEIAARGEFAPSENDQDILQAALAPLKDEEEAGADIQGAVTLDAQAGKYTVKLEGLPSLEWGRAYVGWFKGVDALSGAPLNTGALKIKDGSVETEFEVTWVQGPPIEYFYTLGLSYFYMAECEKSYPLFEAALQMDPDDANALDGIKLCQETE